MGKTYSIYLDEVEHAALERIARGNHSTVNAVCRDLIRSAIGLPAHAIEVPADIREWAERRRAAAEADKRVA